MLGILNYGLGNVFAFKNVYDSLGIDTLVVNTASDLLSCSKIILPGVGSFDSAIYKLKSAKYFDALESRVLHEGIPILGICIGMHMLAESSEEGNSPGLGWIPGVVKKLPVNPQGYNALPHMGWNNISSSDTHPLLNGVDECYFYFLHSYYFEPSSGASTICTFCFDGIHACGVSNGRNIIGIQFHPEKSHDSGITLLRNFFLL